MPRAAGVSAGAIWRVRDVRRDRSTLQAKPTSGARKQLQRPQMQRALPQARPKPGKALETGGDAAPCGQDATCWAEHAKAQAAIAADSARLADAQSALLKAQGASLNILTPDAPTFDIQCRLVGTSASEPEIFSGSYKINIDGLAPYHFEVMLSIPLVFSGARTVACRRSRGRIRRSST